jgi:AcrR family transcriptional regulator
MAIIVDKVQKRKNIASSCINLFVQGGIQDLTISQVAKEACVGKGTLYDYFKNKEDIVFEILTILVDKHGLTKQNKILNATSTKDKIKMFFNFYYNDEDNELRQIYKEYLSISLTNSNQEMVAFQTKYLDIYMTWFETLIQEGIDKKEIIPESLELAKGIYFIGDGMFLNHSTTNAVSNIEEELNRYIDALFILIEVKK